MPKEAPSYIQDAGVIRAPINYKWNNDLALKFSAARDQNLRLSDALGSLSVKATIATGIAIAEWIIWRFEGYADLSDALRRIDAAWASVIDPAYTKDLDFELTDEDDFHDREIVKGPTEIALDLLGNLSTRYMGASTYVRGPVVRLAMLARHLMPDKKAFDHWLSETLRHAAGAFPANPAFDEDAGTYDASHEKPVPREFFDPSFAYSEAAANRILQDFLRTLDPATNPYLRSPEEMKAKGFKGTPYTL